MKGKIETKNEIQHTEIPTLGRINCSCKSLYLHRLFQYFNDAFCKLVKKIDVLYTNKSVHRLIRTLICTLYRIELLCFHFVQNKVKKGWV